MSDLIKMILIRYHLMIREFTELPGTGEKDARRITLSLVRSPRKEHESLIKAIDAISKDEKSPGLTKSEFRI